MISDGVYLFKPVFREYWDLKIYLKTAFEIAMQRGMKRDSASLGGIKNARDRFLQRYHTVSRIYIDECGPESFSDIIIDSTNLDRLQIVKDCSVSMEISAP